MATTSLPTVAEVEAMINDAIDKINSGTDIDLQNVATDILPSSDNVRDLGSNAKRWAQIRGG